MAAEKSAVEDIAAGLGSVFSRIGEFFHIFDLSFFVGGASSFAALLFLYLKIEAPREFPFSPTMEAPREFPFSPWVGVLALVLACYICGLLAFAVGREISRVVFKRNSLLTGVMQDALRDHGLAEVEDIIGYAGRTEEARYWRLYVRMWSELVHAPSSPVVLQHLMRYWAMAATYDGLAFSFLLWAVVMVAVQVPAVAPHPVGHWIASVAAIGALLAAYAAFSRGLAYFKYQAEDLITHFAVIRKPLIGPPLPPGTPPPG
ncbi:hypothetical protein [Longimicrobium sp.]|uniref:hypothetical protein n=1 Tax=Longimicrobium sp. TaxID=2029185 RepID=UPI002E31B574|nr:hypothetical protein [Longimicrobium sp.]HEX6038101.1 hypothetical protein [Longimicrobium sp.]